MNKEYEKRIEAAESAADEFFNALPDLNTDEDINNKLQDHNAVDELYLQAYDATEYGSEEEFDFFERYTSFYEYKVITALHSPWFAQKLNGRKYITEKELEEFVDVSLETLKSSFDDKEHDRINEAYKKFYGDEKNIFREEFKKAIAEVGISVKSGGCYIATAVYGSYDCPQVWTLRRYRDNKLSNSLYGKMFIDVYYAVSPVLLKIFGKNRWFILSCKRVLDPIIKTLNAKGYQDTPYNDV